MEKQTRINKGRKTNSLKIPVGYLIIILIIVLITVLIWFMSLFEFPAKKYVKSALNAICYNNTGQYKKLTDASEEELNSSIEEDLRMQAEVYAAYFGLTNISDESMEMLIDFSRDVYTYSKFKVTKQKKENGDYVVTVKVAPVLFDDISKKEVNKYIEDFNEAAENGDYLYDTDAVYQEKFLEGLLNVYRNQLNDIEYGKKEKIKINVKKVSNNRYEADLTDVLNALIKFE